jgi:uncharacterized membrane protein YhiD involved in acid resistance
VIRSLIEPPIKKPPRACERAEGSGVITFEINMLLQYLAQFFLAVLLGVLVSFRRKMTRYDLYIIQAHAFLATAGAMFMLVISGELTTAVGLLGAASIVRYRYAIRNPRDAGTLVIALGLGMACGTPGMMTLAIGAGAFVVIMTYVLEHFPQLLLFPRIRQREQIELSVLTRDYDVTMRKLNDVFQKRDITYILRTMAQKTSESKMGMAEIEMTIEYPIETNLSELTFELSDENLVRISWQTIKAAFF